MKSKNRTYSKFDLKVNASPAQKSMWVLNQISNLNSNYNISCLYKIKGEVNLKILEESVNFTFSKHEILRTYFIEENGELFQACIENYVYRIQQKFFAGYSEMYEFISNITNKKTNLKKLPLINFYLIEINKDEYFFCIIAHHIISDQWSIQNILIDIANYYNGTEREFTKSNIQYIDFCAWQTDWLRSTDYLTKLNYWKDHLKDSKQSFFIPSSETNLGRYEKTFSSDLAKIFRDYSYKENKSLFTLIYSFYILYKAVKYQEFDLSIGTVFANRDNIQLSDQVGLYANTVVLRHKFDTGIKKLSDLIEDVSNTYYKAFENQEVPFERIVEEINPNRLPDGNPFFDTMLLYRKKMKSINLGSALLEEESIRFVEMVKFNQIISLNDNGKELEISIDFNKELYSQSMIELFVSDFIEFILNTLSYECFHIENNNHFNLITNFEKTVEKQENDIALISVTEKITYKDLNIKVNKLSALLIKKGIKSNSIVGLICHKNIDTIISILAILKSGGAYLPLAPEISTERIHNIFSDGKKQLLLYNSSIDKQKQLSNLEPILASEEQVYNLPSTNPNISIAPNNLAYIIYTSGSTGEPKGVMVEHKSLTSYTEAIDEKIFYQYENLKSTISAPLTFDASIKQLQLLGKGYELYLIPRDLRVDTINYVNYLIKNQVEVIDTTPSELEILLETNLFEESALKLVLVGGESINTELWNKLTRIQRIEFYNHYGPTECTINTTCKKIEGGEPTIGLPLKNTQIILLDKNNKIVNEINSIGEINIIGENVSEGYLDKTTQTLERFFKITIDGKTQRLYKSGDLAFINHKNEYSFIGRVDDQVKIRGYRIELQEIKSKLLKHPSIHQAEVIVRGEGIAQYIIAIVKPLNINRFNNIAVNKYLRESLPHYMLPTKIITLEKFELNKNGKLMYENILTPVQNYTDSKLSELEYEITKIWKFVLNIPSVSITDNFFTLGGNSILSIKLIIELNKYLNKEVVGIKEVFKYQTIQKLAKYIEEKMEDLK